jgi:hypothetical protein
MQELQVRVAVATFSSSGATRVVFDSDAAGFGFGERVSVVLLITFPFLTKRLIIQWSSLLQVTPSSTQFWQRSKSPSSQVLQ